MAEAQSKEIWLEHEGKSIFTMYVILHISEIAKKIDQNVLFLKEFLGRFLKHHLNLHVFIKWYYSEMKICFISTGQIFAQL